MAAAENAAPNRERAESYLRLQAEAELRLALTMPRYQPPRERVASGVRRQIFRSRRMRRRRAAVSRVMRLQSAGAVRAAPAGRFVRRAASRLRSDAGRAASPVHHAIAAASYQVVRPLRRWRGRGSRPAAPSAADCVARVALLAEALSATGAITEQAEADVLDGLRAALAARTLIDPDALLGDSRYPFRPAAAPRQRAGPQRAIPVGTIVDGEIQGHPVRVYLGALMLDSASAALTWQARFPAELARRGPGPGPGRMLPVIHALNGTTAVDDQSGTYQARFSGGGSPGRWEGRFHLSPAPPASARWLDVTLPGAATVRVRLDVQPADLPVSSVKMPAGEAADRYLDARTVGLLAAGSSAQIAASRSATPRRTWSVPAQQAPEDGAASGIFRIAAGLLAAGVLTASSPSLRRLAAVAGRRGQGIPEALGRVEPGTLPADWLSLIARNKCTDGPAGVIPVAAALPEVDGVSCVIAEILSEPESATLQAHARGWPEPRRHRILHSNPFSWSARDDLGGWYAGSEAGWRFAGGEADLQLRLHPPVNPLARTLQIILTGKTAEVSVTVPLDWQEGL